MNYQGVFILLAFLEVIISESLDLNNFRIKRPRFLTKKEKEDRFEENMNKLTNDVRDLEKNLADLETKRDELYTMMSSKGTKGLRSLKTQKEDGISGRKPCRKSTRNTSSGNIFGLHGDDRINTTPGTRLAADTGRGDNSRQSAGDTGTGRKRRNTEGNPCGPKTASIYPEEAVFQTKDARRFSSRRYAGFLKDKGDDVSGMCASRRHRGIFYFLNDGAEENNNVYAIDLNDNGRIVSTISFGRVPNVDWEDMACGPCSCSDKGPTGNCIYVADAGKSNSGPANKIYKIREPDNIREDQEAGSLGLITIEFSSVLKNVEAFMVSPKTCQMYLMDSAKSSYRLHKIVDGQIEEVTRVDLWSRLSGPKAADISPDGTGWVFKMREGVYYFYVPSEEPPVMEEVLGNYKNIVNVPYDQEYYGTSVAWSVNGSAVFTVSEGTNEAIYRYDRLD